MHYLANLTMIWAQDKNGLIGKNNALPWKIAEDLAYFRSKTLGHNVIMGRNTWLSLGSLLDGRTNIMLSSRKDISYPGLIVCHSISEVLDFIRDEKTFVIGGAKVFDQFLPFAGELCITMIDAEFDGDTYFQVPDMKDWKQEFYETQPASNGLMISFNEYRRKN